MFDLWLGEYKNTPLTLIGVTMKIKIPSHVLNDLIPIWKLAAKRVASKRSLINKAGKINYLAINSEYINILKENSKKALMEGRTASRKRVLVSKKLEKSKLKEFFPIVDSLLLKAEELNTFSRDEGLEIIISRIISLKKIIQNLIKQKD